jgi:hypothetical protein
VIQQEQENGQKEGKRREKPKQRPRAGEKELDGSRGPKPMQKKGRTHWSEGSTRETRRDRKTKNNSGGEGEGGRTNKKCRRNWDTRQSAMKGQYTENQERGMGVHEQKRRDDGLRTS